MKLKWALKLQMSIDLVKDFYPLKEEMRIFSSEWGYLKFIFIQAYCFALLQQSGFQYLHDLDSFDFVRLFSFKFQIVHRALRYFGDTPPPPPPPHELFQTDFLNIYRKTALNHYFYFNV